MSQPVDEIEVDDVQTEDTHAELTHTDDSRAVSQSAPPLTGRTSSVIEVPLESPERPKAKAKARGKRGPDKKPRAKPAPRPPTRMSETSSIRDAQHSSSTRGAAPSALQESSDSSADEATMSELRSLQMLRSIRAYDQNRATRKQDLYSSWFR